MEFIDKSDIMKGIGPDTTADLLEKAMGHKYFKREGSPGNYKYYYTEEQYKKAKGTSKESEKNNKEELEEKKGNEEELSITVLPNRSVRGSGHFYTFNEKEQESVLNYLKKLVESDKSGIVREVLKETKDKEKYSSSIPVKMGGVFFCIYSSYGDFRIGGGGDNLSSGKVIREKLETILSEIGKFSKEELGTKKETEDPKVKNEEQYNKEKGKKTDDKGSPETIEKDGDKDFEFTKVSGDQIDFKYKNSNIRINPIHGNTYRLTDKASGTWTIIKGSNLQDAYENSKKVLKDIFPDGLPDFYPKSGTKYVVTGEFVKEGAVDNSNSINFYADTHYQNPNGTGNVSAKKGDIITFDRTGEDNSFFYIDRGKEKHPEYYFKYTDGSNRSPVKGDKLWVLLWTKQIKRI